MTTRNEVAELENTITELMTKENRQKIGWSLKDIAGKLDISRQKIQYAASLMIKSDKLRNISHGKYVLNISEQIDVQTAVKHIIDLLLQEPRAVTGWDRTALTTHLGYSREVVSAAVTKMEYQGVITRVNGTTRYTLNPQTSSSLYKQILVHFQNKHTEYIDCSKVSHVSDILKDKAFYFTMVIDGCCVTIIHADLKKLTNTRNEILRRVDVCILDVGV